MSDTDKPNEEKTETPDPPKEAVKETPAPDPAPSTPAPDTDKVTRQEFTGLSESVAKISESVTTLIETLQNSNPVTHDKPISKPWTHWGSKDN